MNEQKPEIPFALPLDTIVKQLGNKERINDPKFIDYVVQSSILNGLLLNRFAEVSDNHGGRLYAAKNIVARLNDGGYLEEKIHYLILTDRELLHGWSDNDKRALVDEGLTVLIQPIESLLNQDRQMGLYYEPYLNDENKSKLQLEMNKFKSLREQLSQRAYPTPHAARK